MAGRFGYEIRCKEPESPEGVTRECKTPYRENPEVGAKNLSLKLDRIKKGEPFEWPDVLALNRVVVSMLGSARNIAELGGGTGAFAYEAAAQDPSRKIVCSEFDTETSKWAAENRNLPNVRYTDGPIHPEDGPFDVVVSIEVIEHVDDFAGFLRTCCSLAPRAIITTPNRERNMETDIAGPPPYTYHVREWTAGEFYWVLRCFYKTVDLYSMPDPEADSYLPISITDRLTPLIADCSDPMGFRNPGAGMGQ